METRVRVYTCPACTAPLPPAVDGEHVRCTYCGEATVIHDGCAAIAHEQASRREAEALYATLGAPPSGSQRLAAFLVAPLLWVFGFPILLGVLHQVGDWLRQLVEWSWESVRHERLMHVASPVGVRLLTTGFVVAISVALLIWSLFGERVDARRDLQAALACKPPRTEGGPAHCRHCDAPLELPAGALGVRCAFCGADNLVQVPAAWAAKADKIDAGLRLGTQVARERRAIGRRRVRRAMLWRVPLVVALLAFATRSAWLERHVASWSDLHLRPRGTVALSMLGVHGRNDSWSEELHAYAACSNVEGRRNLLRDATLSGGMSRWCDRDGCDLVVMFALAHGDRLRLVRQTPGAAHLDLLLAPAWYHDGNGMLGGRVGDPVVARDIPPGEVGATALEATIATGGWYTLVAHAAADTAFEPCVSPAGPAGPPGPAGPAG